eukprot:6040755-Amphidinium_carterae.1
MQCCNYGATSISAALVLEQDAHPHSSTILQCYSTRSANNWNSLESGMAAAVGKPKGADAV